MQPTAELDLKSVDDLSIQQGNIVYFRPDFNVMKQDGEIKDTTRIDQSVPAIQSILAKGGIPVIVAHAEDKQGTVKHHPSMDKVADYLRLKLNPVVASDAAQINVILVRSIVEAQQALTHANPGTDVVFIDNIRKIEKGETSKADADRVALAQRLKDAINPQFAVSDAFSVAHRPHMSVKEGMLMVSPECRAIGDAARKELTALLAIHSKPAQHQLQIMGGAKLGDKIDLAKKMLEAMDAAAGSSCDQAMGLAVVGALATNFAMAKYNIEKDSVGTSLISESDIETARELLEQFDDLILVPVDVRIAPVSGAEDLAKIDEQIGDLQVVNLDQKQLIPLGYAAVDIGPRSEQAIKDKFAELKKRGIQGSVVWNGPAGVDVQEKSAGGTMIIAQAIDEYAQEGGASYVGGGDSYKSLKLMAKRANQSADDVTRRVNASTAGGASLAGLGAKDPKTELPGVAALYDRRTVEQLAASA